MSFPRYRKHQYPKVLHLITEEDKSNEKGIFFKILLARVLTNLDHIWPIGV